jgi:hypothetical protein
LPYFRLFKVDGHDLDPRATDEPVEFSPRQHVPAVVDRHGGLRCCSKAPTFLSLTLRPKSCKNKLVQSMPIKWRRVDKHLAEDLAARLGIDL